MYMKISYGNFLCSYFYLKEAKTLFFSFFFFYKIGEQEDGKGPAREGWLVLVWGSGRKRG
jgi:hypothetical protein